MTADPEQVTASPSRDPRTPSRQRKLGDNRLEEIDPRPVHTSESEAEDDDDQDEQEDDEPKLKYHRLTGNLSSVYRGGDATSSFIVSGDKMILGSHNGNVVCNLSYRLAVVLTMIERVVPTVLPTAQSVQRPFCYNHCHFCYSISCPFSSSDTRYLAITARVQISCSI